MESPGRFLFQKRNEKIDWRKLASVDIGRISRDVDVDAIQENILSVTYCNIEHELGYHGLDANFIKLFQLAQLTIEYLLHCQEYLQQCMEEKESQITTVRQQNTQLNSDHEITKSELYKRTESYRNLKKELQKMKKLLGDYQLMIRAGANGLHKCTCCSKSFVSEYYLRSHLERRHPEEARKLQPLEINYQSTQSFRDVELHNDLNNIRSRLKLTEDELRKERENMTLLRMKESETNVDLFEKLRLEHESWKAEEQGKMKMEMEAYKEMMVEELKKTQAEKDILQMNLQQLQKESVKKKSTLGDLMDDETGVHYKDLYGKMRSLEKKFAEEMVTLQQKHDKDVKVQGITNQKKVEKEHEKFLISEKQRNEDRKYYEEQIQQLHRKIAQNGKTSEKVPADEVDNKPYISLRPPESPRQSAPSPAPIAKELPEKDSICLWVSVNQSVKHIHRVFRTAASTKGDWKDVLSFHALLQPVGDFQKPIYVYSCGGSPYWRQYVSESKLPPSGYKHDFTFYVSTTKLLGTVKLYVHEAGSGAISHTTISKEENLERWKHKGLFFYALKSGPVKNAVVSQLSGTFNSDMFESISDDDDVSVSSFTGTDVVKQNLADALKRSREDLVDIDDEKNKKTNEDEKKDDDRYVRKEEEQSSNEEENENFGGTSSGSLLISTLPEKGQFFPFPNNPLAMARYNHGIDMVMAQRKEIMEILDDQLEKRGVDPEETQMSMNVYKSKMKNHEKEEKLKDKAYPGFVKERQNIRQKLDEFCEKMFVKKGQAALLGVVKSISKFKSKANVKESRPLPNLNTPNVEDRVHSSVGSMNQPSTAHDEEDEEEEESSGGQMDVQVGGRNKNEEDRDLNEDDNFDVTDSSEWDSGDDVKGVATIDSSPYQQQEEPYQPKMRPPQGEKVKELAASLEASLTLRDPNKKKLAGAVDLYNRNEVDSNPKAKRTVSFHDKNQYDREDDEESDFSLESPDEHQKAISYPSSSKYRPSASSTPNGANKTAVTEFKLDDFDDDESL